MPKHLMPAILALPVCVLVLATAPKPAHAGLHCDIPRNPTGSVALQDKPNTRARVIAHMNAGDEVELLEGLRGKWVEVRHWHGQDRKSPARASDTRRGWVEARFIGACG